MSVAKLYLYHRLPQCQILPKLKAKIITSHNATIGSGLSLLPETSLSTLYYPVVYPFSLPSSYPKAARVSATYLKLVLESPS